MYKDKILACYRKIKPYIHRTPVLTSSALNEISGSKLYFKCENFQKTGSFKIRGALNAILNLPEKTKKKGVLTHSSGNFAQAISVAAKKVGTKAYVVMPLTAPEVKKQAVRDYGGEIIECEPTYRARETTAEKVRLKKNVTFIHSANDIDVVIGQATVCLELLEEHPELEYVVAPVSGGGLLAGTALSAHYFGKNCKTIGGEPFEADDAYRSLKNGKIETNKTTNTIADALKTQLGDITFPLIRKYVDSIIRVTEEEIIYSMKLIWERMKIIAEPSSAVALAAVLKEQNRFQNTPTGIILSGGNVDLTKLPF